MTYLKKTLSFKQSKSKEIKLLTAASLDCSNHTIRGKEQMVIGLDVGGVF